MGSVPNLAHWVKGSGVAVAAAQIRSLAQEFPHAASAAKQEEKEKKKKKKKKVKKEKEKFIVE